MNIEDKFEFTTKYGTFYPIARFVVGRYNNDNLALSIQTYDKESEYWDTYCTCTINTNIILGDDCIAIKNYSENEGIEMLLIRMGIIESKPSSRISSGYVMIPIYNLTDSGKELFKDVDNN